MSLFVKHVCAYLFEAANVLELWELNLLQVCFLKENSIVVVWLMCRATKDPLLSMSVLICSRQPMFSGRGS